MNTLNQNVIIIEPTVNFCMNVERTHNSSSTYFQIKRSGICQRCFCNKISDLSGIQCKEYYSKEIPLSPSLKKLLFGPDKKISNIELKVSDSKMNIINNCKKFLQQLEIEMNLNK